MAETTQVERKPKPVGKTDGIRIRKETKKRVLTDLAGLNKKSLGRKVTPDDYLSLAISLMTKDHLENLKDKTLSNKDRLEIKYQEYCSKNGKVTKDEFLGALLLGHVSEAGAK